MSVACLFSVLSFLNRIDFCSLTAINTWCFYRTGSIITHSPEKKTVFDHFVWCFRRIKFHYVKRTPFHTWCDDKWDVHQASLAQLISILRASLSLQCMHHVRWEINFYEHTSSTEALLLTYNCALECWAKGNQESLHWETSNNVRSYVEEERPQKEEHHNFMVEKHLCQYSQVAMEN